MGEGKSAARDVVKALERVHADIRAMAPAGPPDGPVHGPAIPSRIYLIGQAPGPHEARLGRPFAWKAGKTLFSWLERAVGAGEEEIRARIYMAAVVRCFPGRTASGGDRVPSTREIAAWRPFIEREVLVLMPALVIPVGRLAIAEVLGRDAPMVEVVGRRLRTTFHGLNLDVISLPHPSGASSWFKLEPGRALLEQALRLLARHAEMRRAFPGRRAEAR
ncbi:MAG TPA: uracil-DNA glycosylase family protein [Anaeromyxobacteraceae bacterium]|nr:uracil-DNA glycosylase family protein [Anaeromyxobacteraceae bacterium]